MQTTTKYINQALKAKENAVIKLYRVERLLMEYEYYLANKVNLI